MGVLTKAERQAILKMRKKAYMKKQARMWMKRNAKHVVCNALLAILLFCGLNMLFWGCALDSENSSLVLKMFVGSSVASGIDAVLLWILGGKEL